MPWLRSQCSLQPTRCLSPGRGNIAAWVSMLQCLEHSERRVAFQFVGRGSAWRPAWWRAAAARWSRTRAARSAPAGSFRRRVFIISAAFSGFKSPPGLEERGSQVQDEEDQRDYRARRYAILSSDQADEVFGTHRGCARQRGDAVASQGQGHLRIDVCRIGAQRRERHADETNSFPQRKLSREQLPAN